MVSDVVAIAKLLIQLPVGPLSSGYCLDGLCIMCS